MESNNWVIYDGSLKQAAEPVAPVESRGLMYGDGCFETLRSYKGAYFRPGDHLERLQEAARFLDIDFPDDLKLRSFKRLSESLLDKNGFNEADAVIRIQIWRSGQRGYGTHDQHESHYSILATPLPEIPASVSLATVDIKRIPNESLPSRYKLTNNINYIKAAEQAKQKEADDAMMLTIKGYLSETTIANLFWIIGDTVCTPSEECDLLPGITRNILIRLISESDDIALKEGKFRPEDILKADAVWICNSVRELVPVSRIDNVAYDSHHSFLKQLRESYQKILHAELDG